MLALIYWLYDKAARVGSVQEHSPVYAPSILANITKFSYRE